MSRNRLEIVQGDDRRVIVPVRDQSGQPVDISGAQSIEVAVVTNYGATPSITKTLAANTITITGSNDGFFFDLTAVDTGALLAPRTYVLEAQLVTSSGLTYTVLQSTLLIKQQAIT